MSCARLVLRLMRIEPFSAALSWKSSSLAFLSQALAARTRANISSSSSICSLPPSVRKRPPQPNVPPYTFVAAGTAKRWRIHLPEQLERFCTQFTLARISQQRHLIVQDAAIRKHFPAFRMHLTRIFKHVGQIAVAGLPNPVMHDERPQRGIGDAHPRQQAQELRFHHGGPVQNVPLYAFLQYEPQEPQESQVRFPERIRRGHR